MAPRTIPTGTPATMAITIEYATRTSVREKSLVMLPDQIFAAVSRSVSIGDGSKSLLTHPPLAASHQIATSRIRPDGKFDRAAGALGVQPC